MRADEEPRTSRTVYWRDSVPGLVQRFAVAIAVFVVFMAIGAAVEGYHYPTRAGRAWALWGLESLAGLAGVLGCLLPASRRVVRAGAALSATSVAALVCAYHGSVNASAERLATVLGCILNLLAVVVPWGTVPQTFLALGTLGSFGLASPRLVATESVVFPFVVLAAAATTSICAAFFLDRYRFEAFRQTALQTEEAEVAAALGHVSRVLSRSLGADDVRAQVTQLTRTLLACDFASLFLCHGPGNSYQHASTSGGREDVVADLAGLELTPSLLPVLTELRPGALIEIARPDGHPLVSAALLERLRTSSALGAAVALGDRVIGLLAAGYHQRTGAFSDRQRRLVLGIASAAAIALENSRLVEDLRAANRLKSEFVATMSHELRTPLNVIMGYTQMLADGAVGPEDPAAFAATLDRIQRNAIDLLDLITATLDLGRLEAGRETVALAPVSLDELFVEIGRQVEAITPGGVALEWVNELGAVPILTDRAKLKTILRNLVGNALKFTSAGSVRVLARPVAGGVEIAVEDTGIGIAPQHLSLVFEMFRQVDSSSTRRHGGVGLGLHIVRRLVDLLGGTIAVQSAVGVGSTFVVRLPARTAVVAATAA